jgi:transcriptional regulator with XRE-family HTH domain
MTDPEPTEFDTSGLLRRARRTADLSQRDLAARAGVSPATVARAELPRGTVSLGAVVRLLRAAGMRLAVIDESGRELVPMRSDAIRDRARRLYPAHLDPEPLWRKGRLRANRVFRDDRVDPVAALERRTQRDRTRHREGTPEDHPGIELTQRPPSPPPPYRLEDHEPVPECECGLECERACVPECTCQCEPPLLDQTTWSPFRSAA